ncbi:hypothetical protein GCK32_014476 [Trichostrongylus colubriformis]|uniref:Uncharacterized protein n=1 Tax=Trichostrongylus colubriformis TaxID=6319 RepID=A0AAN8FP62_TRICO
MAFYFALLNVSAKRDDRSASTSSSHRQKHRRHSIASIESPVLDYRLLPKPQVVRNEHYYEEPESGPETSKQNTRHRLQNQNRSASSSRPIAEATSSRGRDGRRNGTKMPKERPQVKGLRKSDSAQLDTLRKMKQKSENGRSHDRQWRTLERELMEREFCAMQMASSSRRAAAAAEAGPKMMNGSVEREGSRVVENPATVDFDRRWRGKRPIVVKRRVSPQESSTSDSRRSSNQSTHSPQRNDSLVSSASSRHTSEAIPEVASPVGEPDIELHKLSNSSMPSRICELPRSVTLKKVTFENDTSQYLVNGSFLDDRRVLIRRGSGSAILPRSVTEQFAPTTPTTLLPSTEGTAALAGLAFGAALWAPLIGESERTPRKQNATNDAIEETIGQGRAVRSLLRRRSTSDRHVVFGFQNKGFHMSNDETPESDMTRTASGATLVPFPG